MILRLRFVWQGLLRRWGSALLSVVTGALSLTALILILWLQASVPEAVKARISETDMVIGPKSSGLDLTLCCALHLTPAAALIDPAAIADRLNASDLKPYIRSHVPIAMGDNYNGRRIVWTTPDILPFYAAELSTGRVWDGAMEVVAGAEAARTLRLETGTRFRSSHGLSEDGEGHEAEYTLTGILKPTGGVLDHLLLADLSSIAAVHDHAHETHGTDHALSPLRVNAVLVRFTSPIAQASVPVIVSQSESYTAVSPRLELARMMSLVRPLIELATVIALMLGVLAGLILILTLVQSLNRRARELSLLRFLGMSRRDLGVFSFAEALIVTHLAFVLGLGLTVIAMTMIAHSLSLQGLTLAKALSANLLLTLYGMIWLVSGLATLPPLVRLGLSRDDEGLRA